MRWVIGVDIGGTNLVVGAVAADVVAGQRDGIARLGALGHEVVLQAGANALQV